MSAITFAFDQKEMNNLINSAADDQNILISIVSAKAASGRKSNLFLAAQLSDAVTNAPVKSLLPPPVGCPNPPGWKTDAIPRITPAQLAGAPKFIIPANEKNKLNLKPAKDQLFVDLEAFIDEQGLQTRLAFKQTKTSKEAIAVTDKLL